jgi:transcriptional regulator with XRE-family HTH domain
VSKPSVPTLSQILADRGISLDALAVLAELDPSTAYRIRNGYAKPRPTTVVRLASALGIGARRMHLICQASWTEAHPEEAQIP